jgi:hypothetical protein
MKAEDQVKAVVEELKRRNPGYDGRARSFIRDGEVVALNFKQAPLRDLFPLQALTRLELVDCMVGYGTKTPPPDLSQLQGLPLNNLNLGNTSVSDLTPLRRLPLRRLALDNTAVTDLTPLRGMPLEALGLVGCPVTALAPLKGMPLEFLRVDYTRVRDLSPLRGMRLKQLRLTWAPVADLSPLQGMSLEKLWLEHKPYTGTEHVRGMTTLQTINDRPPAEFWKEYDRQVPRARDLPPLNENWLKFVQDLPAGQRVGAVVEELKRRNPGWAGEATEKRDDGKGLSLTLQKAEPVGDLTPLRALSDLTELRYLTIGGHRCGRLADLTPLKGLRLKSLTLLKARVVDLSGLRGMPLEVLDLHGTWVVDLSPLVGMPLKSLDCTSTFVADLFPLREMPLKSLALDLKPYRGIGHVRAMPTLEKINGKLAAQFWKEYDAAVGAPR